MNNFKKIILFILIILLIVPPFFSGGNNVFIRGMIFVLAGLAGLLFVFGLKSEQNIPLNRGDVRGVEGNILKSPYTPFIKGGVVVFIFLFLYLLFGLISVFFSVSPYHSAALWLEGLSYAVLFLVVAKIKLEKREIDWLIKIFLAASVVLSIIGIYFYVVGSYSRLTSLFWWPNPFAGYLLFALFLGLEWVLNSNGHQNDDFVGDKKETPRTPLYKGGVLPILFLSLISFAFILTGSRGAFLSFVLVLPVYFWLKFFSNNNSLPLDKGENKRGWRGATPPPLRPPLARGGIIGKSFIRILAVILLSVVFIINFLKNDSFSFANHIKQSGTKQDFSSGIRLKYWQGAREMFKDRPLTGWGAGTFGTVYRLYQKDAISAGKYAHNLYLEVLAEQGIFTAIFFILFLVAVLKSGFIPLLNKEGLARLALGEPRRREVARRHPTPPIPPLSKGRSFGDNYFLGLFCALLAFLIHNGVDVDWHFSANTIVFWIFLGLLYNVSRRNNYSRHCEESASGDEAIPARWANRDCFATLAMTILLILSGTILLRGNYFYEKGINLKNDGNLAEAEVAFQKSIFLNPNPDYLKELGIILYSRALNANNAEREMLVNQALKISLKAIKYDSYNSLNYELAGKIYLARGNLSEAEKNFRKAVELDKFNPAHYINLASLLINEERKDEARDLINKILSFYPEEVVANRKAYIMANQEITSGIEKEIEYLRYLLGMTSR